MNAMIVGCGSAEIACIITMIAGSVGGDEGDDGNDVGAGEVCMVQTKA